VTGFAGIRTVTFDCWGTLIVDARADLARAQRVEAIGAICGVEEAGRAEALLNEAWAVHFDHWVAGRQWGSGGMASWIAERTLGGTDGVATRLTEAFEEAALRTGIGVVDAAEETLASLKESGYAIALVCDTGFTPGRVVRRLFAQHDLPGHIDAWAFSDEVGVPKPAQAMFEAALGAAGGRPGVHVGDLRRTDVAGARGAGLSSVRFTGVWDDTSDLLDADVVIQDLRELAGLLS
jgi:putative hydrolase of the HAD superfamily